MRYNLPSEPDTISTNANIDEALEEFQQNNATASTLLYNSKIDKGGEYAWRLEASKDGLVRGILSSHLVNAIGVRDGERPNISLSIGNDNDLDDNLRDYLLEEGNKALSVILDSIKPMMLDALAFGDGYTSLHGEKGVGLVESIYNPTTKPFLIVPIKSNKKKPDLGYKIIGTSRGTSSYNFIPSRRFARPSQKVFVGRIELKDGTSNIQDVSDKNIPSMNPFLAKERYYQEQINGGLLEGLEEEFSNYYSTIRASKNKKIISSIVERFVTVALNNTTKDEREIIKKSVNVMLRTANSRRTDKISNNDLDGTVLSHIIATTGDSATSGIDINDSSIEFNDDMEDVLFHTKRLVGGLKWHIDLTTFSDSQVGERSEDSIARNSEQIEEVGGEIREAISRFVLEVIKIHFTLISNKEPIDKLFHVNFNGVVSRAKKEQEFDRVETLNNQQQFNDIIISIKDMGIDDSEEGRAFLKEQIRDLTPLHIIDKDAFIEYAITLCLKKEEPPAEEGAE